MGTRYDLGSDDFAQRGPGALTGFDGGFYGGDLTADDDRHIRCADLLVANEFHVGGLEHRVGRFENGGQSRGKHSGACVVCYPPATDPSAPSNFPSCRHCTARHAPSRSYNCPLVC